VCLISGSCARPPLAGIRSLKFEPAASRPFVSGSRRPFGGVSAARTVRRKVGPWLLSILVSFSELVGSSYCRPGMLTVRAGDACSWLRARLLCLYTALAVRSTRRRVVETWTDNNRLHETLQRHLRRDSVDSRCSLWNRLLTWLFFVCYWQSPPLPQVVDDAISLTFCRDNTLQSCSITI
jgi:hypothetical protein